MLLLDRQSVAAAPRRGGANRVQLRLRADGQLLELPLGKTTIGSSPRCNVRIQQPGVQPVHCLIVNGLEGLSVRRWAADTQLNGAPFDDAPFHEGDCLVLGGIELELVPSKSTAVQQATWAPAPRATSDELLDTVHESVDAISSLETDPIATASAIVEQSVERELELVDTIELNSSSAAEVVFRELQMACAISRGRGRKLLAALRNKKNECNELHQRSTEANQQLAELKRLQAEREQEQGNRDNERREWELQFQDLRRQIGDWENRLASQSQRMTTLQRELAAAWSTNAPVAMPAGQAMSLPQCERVSREVEPIVVGRSDGGLWTSAPAFGVEAASPKLASQRINEPTHAVEQAFATEEPAFAVEEPAHCGESSTPVMHSPVSDWSITRDKSAGNRGRLPLEESSDVVVVGTDVSPAARSAWPGKSPTDSSDEAVAVDADDINPFAESSIWKQRAGSQHPSREETSISGPTKAAERTPLWGSETFGDDSKEITPSESSGEVASAAAESNPWAAPAEVPVGEVAEVAPPKAQPISFIERYSHLFAEETAEETTAAAVAPAQPPAVAATSSKPRAMGIVRNEGSKPTSTAGDDEESVEQYMAKLLQRVRGDGPVRVASQAAPIPVVAEEVASAVKSMSLQQPAPAAGELPQPVAREPMSEDEATKELASWNVSKRKASMPASTTDMGALRALANATARGAISRHELVKHRRDAMTKMIVSTLAGMTSLWLMLLAPNWRGIQFIIACMALMVAAYWAGEAFRALLESMRAAVYDGPDEYLHDSDAAHHALPIDVEDRF